MRDGDLRATDARPTSLGTTPSLGTTASLGFTALPGAALWLLLLLLATTGAWTWAAPGTGVLHGALVLAHAVLGLLALLPLLLWGWRAVRSRVAVAAGLLLAGTVAAVPLLLFGGGPAQRFWLLAHLVLMAAGLVTLILAAPRSWRLAGVVAALLLIAALMLPALNQPGPSGRRGEPLQSVDAVDSPINPIAPRTLADLAQGGEQGRFYPAALSTPGNALLPADTFERDATCVRCHAGVAEEWHASPHRFSGLDNPWYRAVYEDFVADVGTVEGRWCAGCHTPALLVTGRGEELAAGQEGQGEQAFGGVTCTVCHGMTAVESTLGQGDFGLAVPPQHTWATSSQPLARVLFDLSVHLDPAAHRRAYRIDPPAGGVSEACGTCHGGFVTEPIHDRFVSALFDDYFLWQVSSVSGESFARSLYFPPAQGCTDCHMASPERASTQQTGASHRFAAANSALAVWQKDPEQLEAVRRALTSGAVTVDLFAAVADGGVVAAPLEQQATILAAGDSVRLDVVVRNREVGHGFPGGKRELHDCWLEVRVDDADGQPVFWSGRADSSTGAGRADSSTGAGRADSSTGSGRADSSTGAGRAGAGRAEAQAHRFGSTLVDDSGAVVENYRLQDMRTSAGAYLLEFGDSNVVAYRLQVPEDAEGPLTVHAKLNYRTFDPEFHAWAFERAGSAEVPSSSEVTRSPEVSSSSEVPVQPILVVAEDTVTLPLSSGTARDAAPEPEATTEGDRQRLAERWRDYGFALVIQQQHPAAVEAFRRVLELQPDDTGARVGLGWALRSLGDAAEARRLLEEALALDPELSRPRFTLALLEHIEGRPQAALDQMSTLAERYPRDIETRRTLAELFAVGGDFAAAETEYQAVLAIDPRDVGAHQGLIRVYAALGDDERRQRHQELFDAFDFTDAQRQALRAFLEQNPWQVTERQPLHEHRSVELPPTSSGRVSSEVPAPAAGEESR